MSAPLHLEIAQNGGSPHVHEITPGIYTIGSDERNTLILSGTDVSPKHAVLTVRPEGVSIEDLSSDTGTRVAGQEIGDPTELRVGQPVRIGRFTLQLRPATPPAAPVFVPPPAPSPKVEFPPPPAGPDGLKQTIKQQIHKELLERLDVKRLATTHVDESDLHKRVLKLLSSIVKDVEPRLPASVDPKALTKEVYDEAVGLGPLEDLLADPTITEIMVNGPRQVYVERSGKIERTDRSFMDEKSVAAIIERIVSPIGRRIDESQPYVDARLKDGSRVNAIIAPLSLSGPCITIRKFSKVPFTDNDLIRMGTMTPFMAEFTKTCVLLRKNLVVSGGTGSGKTTLLNVLSSYLPDTDRIVTIEDAAELQLNQVHVVRLEARPPNIEGKGAITIRDLVRNALRMRPDRIVVGECRGGEALDMLQAMNTGHDGSLTTVHANSPRDVISRLETMVLMSGMELPVRAIREQIASAIDLIVHTARLSDGSRRIVNITEVVGLEGDKTTMQEIFLFKQTGVGPGGKVQGDFAPTGAVPTFMDELKTKGLTINQSMFDPRGGRQP